MTSGQGVSRISVSSPPDLLDHFDEMINLLGYIRSKAIKVAIRDFLIDYRWKVEEAGIVVGALHMIYDYETDGLEEAMTDTQHRYRGIISSTTQIHLE